MKEKINEYRITITGLVIVFSFLVTFCTAYWTIHKVTYNEGYALIGSCILSFLLFACYIWAALKSLPTRQRNEQESESEPKGIDPRKTQYPQVNIEDKNQILYMAGHADEMNPIHKRNAK